MPDELWYDISTRALRNPRLHWDWPTPIHVARDGDRTHEHYRTKMRDQAFHLLLQIPVTEEWARVLFDGFKFFPRRSIWGAKQEELADAFKRWSPSANSENPVYADLRFVIANKVNLHDDWLSKHPDESVRLGAAGEYHYHNLEDLRSFVEEAGDRALECLADNHSLHQKNSPSVVSEARHLVSRARFGGDWKREDDLRSRWMDAANRLHEHEPDFCFAWDEDPDTVTTTQHGNQNSLSQWEELRAEVLSVSRTLWFLIALGVGAMIWLFT